MAELAERLTAEFDWLPTTAVIRVVTECVDQWPDADVLFIEAGGQVQVGNYPPMKPLAPRVRRLTTQRSGSRVCGHGAYRTVWPIREDDGFATTCLVYAVGGDVAGAVGRPCPKETRQDLTQWDAFGLRCG